jgi:hypothetical protein
MQNTQFLQLTSCMGVFNQTRDKLIGTGNGVLHAVHFWAEIAEEVPDSIIQVLGQLIQGLNTFSSWVLTSQVWTAPN